MEIMKRPTKMDIKKVQERLGDNITFAFVQSAGQALENYFDKDYHEIEFENFVENDYPKWYRLTRFMLIQYSPKQVTEMLLKVFEDVANDYWPWDIVTSISIKKENPTYKTNSKIPILQIAEKFGLKVKNNKCICPFHSDGEPSLTFYPETNSFYCFGCNSGGDVVRFIQLMMEVKNGE